MVIRSGLELTTLITQAQRASVADLRKAQRHQRAERNFSATAKTGGAGREHDNVIYAIRLRLDLQFCAYLAQRQPEGLTVNINRQWLVALGAAPRLHPNLQIGFF